MDKKDFKKNMGNILKKYDFNYTQKAYYSDNDKLIVVINLQKSNYNDSYYMNYGFLIKEITPDISYPKESMCDVMGRFSFLNQGNTVYDLSLKELDISTLEQILDSNLERTILPVLQNGIGYYFEMYPQAIAATKLKTKQYLGLM